MTKLQIQSDTEESAVDIIRVAISAEIKRLEIGLQRTERKIEKFEKEYRVSSEVFKEKFAAEDMKRGDEEYIEWAGELKMREKILMDLKNLKDIEYVTH